MTNRKPKTKFKIGDRVTMPMVDDIPGTVIEVGYNGFTKVQYDDGQMGCTTSDLLVSVQCPTVVDKGK